MWIHVVPAIGSKIQVLFLVRINPQVGKKLENTVSLVSSDISTLNNQLSNTIAAENKGPKSIVPNSVFGDDPEPVSFSQPASLNVLYNQLIYLSVVQFAVKINASPRKLCIHFQFPLSQIDSSISQPPDCNTVTDKNYEVPGFVIHQNVHLHFLSKVNFFS